MLTIKKNQTVKTKIKLKSNSPKYILIGNSINQFRAHPLKRRKYLKSTGHPCWTIDDAIRGFGLRIPAAFANKALPKIVLPLENKLKFFYCPPVAQNYMCNFKFSFSNIITPERVS